MLIAYFFHRTSPFLTVQQANLFITTWVEGGGGGYHRGRRTTPTIIAECCNANGCTWEEYSEYCPVQHIHRSTLQ